ncbi:hypothetical protein NDU88_004686 [Pleurodeles waltl]|uniref:Uncharacterized protein n=1 Tax=Pleurodeles waltl TaxID=8319 RepID=A0AAV7QCR1_PLEWA|nr:hypothetical protein NDU88_004686 [Pleurodeles waltl]
MGRLQGGAVIGRGRDPGLDRRLGHGVRAPRHTLKLPVRIRLASRTLRARVAALGKQGETRPGAVGHWAHGSSTMGITLGAWWWPTWPQREVTPGDRSERCAREGKRLVRAPGPRGTQDQKGKEPPCPPH